MSASESCSPALTPNSPSSAYVFVSPDIKASTTLPALSPRKEFVRDDDISSPPLSPSSSSSSVTQPTTPVHSSATIITERSPTSMNVIPESHSENKSSYKICPSSDSEPANANITTPARQCVLPQPQPFIQPKESSTTKADSSRLTNGPQSNSPSKSQTADPNTTSHALMTACSTHTPNPLQTTNVYINGLPPNFKSEQLYALASRFGNVLSCRTFTRQLADNPSGYGFVLFDSLEAAQQCIDVLRSHHNLHPTFAKQAHKINRMATDPAVTSPTFSNSPATQPAINGQAENGTNYSRTPTTIDDAPPEVDIYIEGLPIDIDVPTLRALIAPHDIKSSRFFADTRVQPPRLIAFVKLGSQAAAQDVRAKLHGRTIRGYSDLLQVFSGKEFRSQLGSPSTQITSPRITTAIGTKLPSGLPMNVQDLFIAESEDPFIALQGGKPKFTSPPSYACRSNGQFAVPPDNSRLQTVVPQQVPRQLSNHTSSQSDIPSALQPLNTTLNELQKNLENVKSLLQGYNPVDNVPNPFTMPSPIATNAHHRHNSHSQNQRFSSAFRELNTLELRPQNTDTVNDLRTINAPAISTSGKQTIGGQLNPLAQAYSLCETNYNDFNPLESVTFGDRETPTGLGLGAPFFTHSGNFMSSANGAIRHARNSSNVKDGILKAMSSVTASSASGGR